MTAIHSIRAEWEPRMVSVFRIVVGILFLQHGTMKLFGVPAVEGAGGELALFPGLISAILELVGGALIIVGLFTRPTAFVLSGMMAVAYFYAHAPRGVWPLQNGGELAVIYSFAFLLLAVIGGGAWSIDAMRKRSVSADHAGDGLSEEEVLRRRAELRPELRERRVGEARAEARTRVKKNPASHM